MAFYHELSEEEKSLINNYNETNYSDLYDREDEENIYKTASALRKEAGLPSTSFNKEDPYTYNELITTKPRTGSIGDDFEKQFSVRNVDTNNDIIQSGIKQEEDGIVANTLKAVSTPLGKGLDWMATGFDKLSDVTIKKGVAGVTSAGTAIYYQGEELVNSFSEGRKFDWIKGAEKWEEKNQRLEYAFGTKLNTSDYLDFRTANEKRKEILNNVSVAKQNELKELDTVGMLADISAGIASGIGVSSALGKLSTLGKTATAVNATSKATSVGMRIAPTVGKVATVLEKTVNPSLNNMAKLGALTAGLAVPYYGLTGKWIFEGDEGATEGAQIVLGSLVMKGAGEGIARGWKGIKDVFSNKQFQEGVELFNKNAQEELGTLKNTEYGQLSPDKRKEIFENINVMRNSKDVVGDTAKSNRIGELIDEGVLKFTKTSQTKGGKNIMEFGYTEKGVEFLPKKIQNEIKTGKRDVSDVVVRTDEAMWNSRQVVAKDVIDQTKLSANTDDLITALKETEARKNVKANTFKQKIVDSGAWNDKKSSFTNYLNYMYDATTAKFVKNADRRLGELLGDRGVKNLVQKADRQMQKQLEGTNLFGKVERIKKRVQNVHSVTGDDFQDFNVYLWAKSRRNKLAGELAKGEDLRTSYILGGQRRNITKADLDAIVAKGETKYNKLAKELQDINKEVLDFEVRAGVRSQQEVDNFIKANPDYIPDRLTIKDIEGFMKSKEFQPEIVKLGKGLKGGSDEFDFSQNSMDNLFQSMAYRTRVASHVEKINTALKLGEESGVVRLWDGKSKLRSGEIGMKTVIDGKTKIAIVPKFYKEAIEKDDSLSRHISLSIISTPTRITKEWATGRLNPFFQIMSPMWELPNALMKNASNQGKTTDFIKSLAGNGLYSTPAGKRAMMGLLEDFGGDFGYIKYLKEEFDAGQIIKNDKEFLKKNGNIKVAKDKISDWLNFGHSIEKYTTRLPLFQSQLKKQGLTKEIFEKAVKEADGNGIKLQQILEGEGYDLKGGGNVVRSLFDYTIASKTIREVSRVLPYLNTSVSATTAMKRLYEDSPAKFMGYAMGAYLIADTLASHNYGTKNVLGLGTEDGEKKAMMINQNDYVKYKVGWVSNDSENVNIFELGRNIPLVEWMYPFLVEQKINGQDVDASKAFNKIVKDFTYIVDLNQEQGLPIDLNKIPNGFKQVLEVGLNRDFFYDTELVPDKIKMKEYKTEEYNKYTDPIFIKASRWIALATGGEQLENGLIQGGHQMSPIEMQKLFKIVDTKGEAGKALSALVTDAETGKGDTKKFLSLMNKQYRIKTSDDELFSLKEMSDEEKMIDNNIRLSFEKTTSVEELRKATIDIVEQYKDYPDFEDKAKKLENEIKRQMTIIKYGKDAFYESSSSSEELAKYYYQIYLKDGRGAVARRMKTIVQMNEDGLYSDGKLEKMVEEFASLIQKKD